MSLRAVVMTSSSSPSAGDHISSGASAGVAVLVPVPTRHVPPVMIVRDNKGPSNTSDNPNGNASAGATAAPAAVPAGHTALAHFSSYSLLPGQTSLQSALRIRAPQPLSSSAASTAAPVTSAAAAPSFPASLWTTKVATGNSSSSSNSEAAMQRPADGNLALSAATCNTCRHSILEMRGHSLRLPPITPTANVTTIVGAASSSTGTGAAGAVSVSTARLGRLHFPLQLSLMLTPAVGGGAHRPADNLQQQQRRVFWSLLDPRMTSQLLHQLCTPAALVGASAGAPASSIPGSSGGAHATAAADAAASVLSNAQAHRLSSLLSQLSDALLLPYITSIIAAASNSSGCSGGASIAAPSTSAPAAHLLPPLSASDAQRLATLVTMLLPRLMDVGPTMPLMAKVLALTLSHSHVVSDDDPALCNLTLEGISREAGAPSMSIDAASGGSSSGSSSSHSSAAVPASSVRSLTDPTFRLVIGDCEDSVAPASSFGSAGADAAASSGVTVVHAVPMSNMQAPSTAATASCSSGPAVHSHLQVQPAFHFRSTAMSPPHANATDAISPGTVVAAAAAATALQSEQSSPTAPATVVVPPARGDRPWESASIAKPQAMLVWEAANHSYATEAGSHLTPATSLLRQHEDVRHGTMMQLQHQFDVRWSGQRSRSDSIDSSSGSGSTKHAMAAEPEAGTDVGSGDEEVEAEALSLEAAACGQSERRVNALQCSCCYRAAGSATPPAAAAAAHGTCALQSVRDLLHSRVHGGPSQQPQASSSSSSLASSSPAPCKVCAAMRPAHSRLLMTSSQWSRLSALVVQLLGSRQLKVQLTPRHAQPPQAANFTTTAGHGLGHPPRTIAMSGGGHGGHWAAHAANSNANIALHLEARNEAAGRAAEEEDAKGREPDWNVVSVEVVA